MDQNSRKPIKAQSAMEYLMTYGWAILAIVIGALVLYSLGIIGGSPQSTTCQPQVGFTCQSIIYSHATGNVMVTLAQTTQSTWSTVNVIMIEQGNSTNGVPSTYFTASSEQMITMPFGTNKPQSMSFPVLNSAGGQVGSVQVGFNIAGDVWAQYTACAGCGAAGSANNPYYYVLMAKVVAIAS